MIRAALNRRPGRPKSAEKRAAIVDAAGQLFLRAGFQNATMDGVASAAQVSKQTVYSHFGSKDELLRACVSSKMRDHQVSTADLPATGDARLALTVVASRMIELLQDPEVVAMMRLMIGELSQPDLTVAFLAEGPDQAVEVVAELLEKLGAADELRVKNTREAAEVFASLVKGHFVIQALLGHGVDLDGRQRQRHAELTVERFLVLCEQGLC